MKPIYRDDIKGNVREIIKEFADSLRGEMNHEDSGFFFGTPEEVRESSAYREYAVYLTDKEMLQAAKP